MCFSISIGHSDKRRLEKYHNKAISIMHTALQIFATFSVSVCVCVCVIAEGKVQKKIITNKLKSVGCVLGVSGSKNPPLL